MSYHFSTICGKDPILIVIQHGGDKMYDHLPKQKCKGDYKSKSIGINLYDHLKDVHKLDPNLIILNLHKSHLNTSDKIEKCTLMETYNTYQYLYTYIDLFLKEHKNGITTCSLKLDIS